MKKAFTLIETLIVVSVIGALASAILLSVAGLQSSARDVYRISELSKLQKAVTTIQVLGDNYPSAPTLPVSPPYGCRLDNCPTLDILIQRAYLGALPKGARPNEYFYYLTGTDGGYEYFIVYTFINDSSKIQGFVLPATKIDWCAQNLYSIGNYYCVGGIHEI